MRRRRSRVEINNLPLWVLLQIIDCDLFRDTITADGFAQDTQRRFTFPLGCQKEVHRGTGLVDYAI
jgi:hypothetical protein